MQEIENGGGEQLSRERSLGDRRRPGARAFERERESDGAPLSRGGTRRRRQKDRHTSYALFVLTCSFMYFVGYTFFLMPYKIIIESSTLGKVLLAMAKDF